MESEPTDLLQIKIEKARAELSEDTRTAIDAVDWKAVILEMRQKKGYSFEQLGDLEIETELVLCGLLSPENYPKELEQRMRISKAEANDLVKEMNEQVFKKIKENLIKNTERKNVFTKEAPPILAQKLSGPVKNVVKETDHSLNNLTPSGLSSAGGAKPTVDPYREIPE